jgi:hypothetical protein
MSRDSLATVAVVLCVAFVSTVGCTIPGPNDAEIGCAYDRQSSPLCPGYEAGRPSGGDASGPQREAGPDLADGSMPAEAGDAAVSSGLGSPCTGPTDCAAFAADYCLVSPTGTFPSFCTYTHCTEAECGTDHVCCDCTMSPVSAVKTFPPGICVLPMTASALPSYGCTCMPQAH